MNMLLTGSTGFLGSVILQKLSLHANVFTLARSSAFYNYSLESQIPIFNSTFNIVIHAGGLAHKQHTINSLKDNYYDINVKGTENLLTGLELSSAIPSYFIFISSVSVYGLEFGSNINEEHLLLAKDSYGYSKVLSECLILDWCKKNNVICTIFRLPLIVGPNPPGNLGKMIKGIRFGYYFNITGNRSRKSMVLADDVACIIQKIYHLGGIYNLTDGYHPSFFELSYFISLKLGKKKPYEIPFWLVKILAKLGDLMGSISPFNSLKLIKITSNLTFDDSKARLVLGWNPTPVLVSDEKFYK